MVKVAMVVALVSALALSGCISEFSNDSPAGSGESQGAPVDSAGPPGEPASGSPANHGDPSIEEGNPQTTAPTANDPWWRIRQTITIDNDFGGAAASDIRVDIERGSITVVPSPDGDYHYELTLEASGGSQEDAQTSFDQITWSHDDKLAGGTLALATVVDGISSPSGGCQGVGPLTTCSGFGWRAYLTAQVPDAPSHALDMVSSTADASIESLTGSRLSFHSTTGDFTGRDLAFGTIERASTTGDSQWSNIEAATFQHEASTGDAVINDIAAVDIAMQTTTGDVAVERITAETLTFVGDTSDVSFRVGTATTLSIRTNTGDQTVSLATQSVELTGGSADIDASFEPTGSGTLTVSLGTGDLDLEMANGARYGHDVEATTNTGDLDVNIKDGETLVDEEEHVHKRTKDFSSRDIQWTTSITTNTGDVSVDA